MADAVATQILFDGERMAIMKFTNISDGTGETKVTKVDVSTLTPSSFDRPCDGVTITKVHALTHGMEVDMYWDATTDVFILSVPQNQMYSLDLTQFGGLWNNAGAGKNGDVQFSTRDASAGDTYTIVLEMVKSYADV
jgi:hypothetical protein